MMIKGKKGRSRATTIPNMSELFNGVIQSTDELEYGLRGVVRLLSGRGRTGKNGYFFEGFKAVFASEIDEEIDQAETFLDYENLKIIIKLPDPADSQQRELIRHEYLKQYSLGADDLKTRAALAAFASLDEMTKQSLINNEKEWSQIVKSKGGKSES